MSIDLNAIQARADAATEGPWKANAGCIRQDRSWSDPSAIVVDYDGERPSIPNAVFIAHARTDVPALLAYARELEARIGRVDEVVRSMDQRVKQNVRNIESGLYDETFTAVAHSVNSFAESSAIRLRAALTATEARA